MNKTFTLFTLMLLTFFSQQIFSAVSMHEIFRNNMILQREKPVAIFGNASVAESVSVNFNGQTKSTTADSNGKWKVFLDAMPKGGPYTLTVTGTNTLNFTNVMLGDVWLLSGQSNMAGRITDSGLNEAASGFSYPDVRTYSSGSNWIASSPSNNQWFSAHGFYFGINYHTLENVPVGLIRAAYVNSAIEKWLDPKSITDNADIVDMGANPGEHFNNLIAPVVGFTIRGCLWDQGENNSGGEGTAVYQRKLESLVNNWRDMWGYDFHFLISSLPWLESQWITMQNGPIATSPNDRYAQTRQAQNNLLRLKNTAVITTIDIADGDIHPNNKPDKGRRMALAAQGMVLERGVEYSGPVFNYMEINGSQLILHFIHTGNGLVIDGTSLEGMAIAGADNVFHWAQGTVVGNTLVISSANVSNPTQARYAWATHTNPKGNFKNSAGIGCNTFRTDAGVENRPYEAIHGQYNTGANPINIPVSSVSASPATLLMSVSETQQLTPTILPANADNKRYVWYSQNPLIATVNTNGLVTAVMPGNTNIVCLTQNEGKKTVVPVTVAVIPVTAVSVSPTSISIPAGSSTQLTATITPANATNKSINWQSANELVATVSSTGFVRAIAEGTTTITATTVDGNLVASSNITITEAIISSKQIVTLFHSDFTGTAPAQNLPWAATSDSDPRVFYSGLTLGNSAKLQGWSANNEFQLRSSHGSKSTITDALSNNDYISFTITPTSGNTLNLNNAQLKFRTKMTSYDLGSKFDVFTSIGGFNLGNQIFTSLKIEYWYTATAPITCYFPSSGYDGITAPIEVRIYLSDATNANLASITEMSLTGTFEGSTPARPIYTASTVYNNGANIAANAFDGLNYKLWQSNSTTGWLQVQLPEAATYNTYDLYIPQTGLNNTPKNWTIQGSNNGVDWTILNTQTNQLPAAVSTKENYNYTRYSFINTTAYSYYRMNITANNGGWQVYVADLEYSFLNGGTTSHTQNMTSNFSFSITPYPASQQINIQFMSEIKKGDLSVIDLQGRIIQRTKLTNSKFETFNISDLATGLYFVKIEIDGKIETIKFMKQ